MKKELLDEKIKFFKKLLRKKDFREEYIKANAPAFKGVVGCFSNFVSEEILHASGLYPVRIIGDLSTSSQPSASVLPSTLCSFIKDSACAYMADTQTLFDLFIAASSCDSLRRLSEVWAASDGANDRCYQLKHPLRATEDAVDYFARTLSEMAGYLHQRFDVSVEEEKLAESIQLMNAIRAGLNKVADSRKKRLISASDYLAIITAAMVMPKQIYFDELKEIISALEDKEPIAEAGKDSPVLLIGPLCDDLDVIDSIESCGLYIAEDDVTNGTRYYMDVNISCEGDLMRNIARGYLNRFQSPTFSDMSSDTTRMKSIIESGRIRGAVYLIQKQCDPHYFNYPVIKEMAACCDVPVLLLEVEHGGREHSFIKPRIEAFAERLTQ